MVNTHRLCLLAQLLHLQTGHKHKQHRTSIPSPAQPIKNEGKDRESSRSTFILSWAEGNSEGSYE